MTWLTHGLFDCKLLPHLPDWEERKELFHGQDSFRPIREVNQDKISIEMFRRYDFRPSHAQKVSQSGGRRAFARSLKRGIMNRSGDRTA